MADAIVTCGVCGNSVKHYPGRIRKFCSPDCYHAAQRRGDVRVGREPFRVYPCHGCGNRVNRTPATDRAGNLCDRVYCSRSCYDAARERSRPMCAHCGERVPGIKAKYCSMDCRVAGKKPTPCTCKNCGVMFSAIKPIDRGGVIDLVAYNGAKTCSPECRNQWIRTDPERKRKIGDAFRGAKHPNWQGGKSLLNSTSARGPNWQAQRKKAIKRDKACVDCGIDREQCRKKYGRDLDVDHVVPFHNFTDYRKANKLGNLACRCASCHRIEEAKRGMTQMVLPMHDRGRGHRGRANGEKINTAKLTMAGVVDIHRRLSAGESQKSVARCMGVSQSAISAIVLRKTWRHVAKSG